MIFLTLFFFDSIEHLPIHLTYKAKVGGLVQYKWMYYLERLGITCILIVWCFLKTFGHSIYFCLPSCIYFSTSRNMLKTMRMLRPWYAKIIFWRDFNIYLILFWTRYENKNQSLSKYDDCGELPSSGNLSIISHFVRPLLKNTISIRYLTDIKFR
jgi:hypothetical protein